MNLPNIPKMPNIPHMTAIGLASVTMLFGGMPGALAHWGHLGELAGHGHLVGAAFGAAAALLAAALVIKDRVQADSGEDAAETDRGTDSEPEGERTDA
jgi:hypothetical protein|tara:strand:- start:907 stop:1200 length:294 start_codon:yes stop_codon:yes gene_type:complete